LLHHQKKPIPSERKKRKNGLNKFYGLILGTIIPLIFFPLVLFDFQSQLSYKWV